jgi:hypothetical protein
MLLNATVWDPVTPQICNILKTQNICYLAIKTAHFITHSEDRKDTLGPVVITTTAENMHNACPDILTLLEANGVEGTVVQGSHRETVKLEAALATLGSDQTLHLHLCNEYSYFSPD